ncbi:hypothetical protein IQ247_15290 [Plectonema cf. radiosum LEGE 06105]|uniref:Uncharacterized protein n=1 Tax=Plectonema cf. radiosum LEGE 06105 TaxID=945769 RepID=A0A8J7FD04_9CYAN|nr:hypothetical protein [Plectonema radiosum]MBE9214013.1 hypothetical protein [Plectonema cf. radiosum LEGE 06105]
MKSKYRNFLADASNQDLAIPHSQMIISQFPEPDKIKHTLTGSSKAVIATIRVLHQLGYANIRDWTPLLPTSNSGEVMSILIRTITVQ